MNNSLNILLIEDDTIEVMKLQRVLASLALKHVLTIARDGEEALRMLVDIKALPDLILLDLNMPKINGIEFLKTIKENPLLKHIPSVVLTTSKNPTDLRACYAIGVAGYVIKPLKYDEYVSKIRGLLEYWSFNELIKTS